MKVGIINNLYPPLDRGGAEKIAYKQAQELRQQGHQVFIITSKQARQKIPASSEKIYYFNSAYQSLGKIPKYLRLIWHLGQFAQPFRNKQLKKILQTEKPDLIISHNLLGLGWRLPIIIKRLKITHHHVLHDIQLLHPSGLLMISQEKIINSYLAQIYQAILRHYFRSVLKISSPSKWLLKLHQSKNFWLNIPTEIKRLEIPKIMPINWPTIIKNILFVGQLEEHKGVLFLLDCVKSWKLANYDFNLSIVGDGRLSNLVLAASQDNQQLQYLGRLENKLVKEIMRKHDCLIIPSICHENSPTVVFEANQVTLPIVAAAVGGLPELAQEFNLKLFPAGDKVALEKIIFKQ